MKNIILIFLLLSACAKKDIEQAVSKRDWPTTCKQSPLAGQWYENKYGKAMRFNTDCTGSIPNCNVTFKYYVNQYDGRYGYVEIEADESANVSNCPRFKNTSCQVEIDSFENGTPASASLVCSEGIGMLYTGQPAY